MALHRSQGRKIRNRLRAVNEARSLGTSAYEGPPASRSRAEERPRAARWSGAERRDGAAGRRSPIARSAPAARGRAGGRTNRNELWRTRGERGALQSDVSLTIKEILPGRHPIPEENDEEVNRAGRILPCCQKKNSRAAHVHPSALVEVEHGSMNDSRRRFTSSPRGFG
jgi:hypothetical protein